MFTDAMTSALQGIRLNQDALASHADRISRWGAPQADGTVPDIDLAQEMVGVLQARRGMQANVAVIRATDEMLGSLIDIMA